MQQTGNTILITGGGTGIGRGLAEAFHKAGNQVIIAGRRASMLEDTVRANPGMRWLTLDIENPDDFQRFVAEVKAEFPALNVLINNAGVMVPEDLQAGTDNLPTAEQTVGINLLGPLRLTAALLPVLLTQRSATVMTVTSGLASVPRARFATYCATKAFIHSWTESLRFQLRGTSIEVLELVPPYVQTGLTGPEQATDPNAMPLADYINETIELLKAPDPTGEILVERVKPLRFAERNGKWRELFETRNQQVLPTQK